MANVAWIRFEFCWNLANYSFVSQNAVIIKSNETIVVDTGYPPAAFLHNDDCCSPPLSVSSQGHSVGADVALRLASPTLTPSTTLDFPSRDNLFVHNCTHPYLPSSGSHTPVLFSLSLCSFPLNFFFATNQKIPIFGSMNILTYDPKFLNSACTQCDWCSVVISFQPLIISSTRASKHQRYVQHLNILLHCSSNFPVILDFIVWPACRYYHPCTQLKPSTVCCSIMNCYSRFSS